MLARRLLHQRQEKEGQVERREAVNLEAMVRDENACKSDQSLFKVS